MWIASVESIRVDEVGDEEVRGISG